MGEIVQLKPEATKRITGDHGGQRYTCIFDPHAPPNERWAWYVDYVLTFRYTGTAPTPERAAANARRKIHALNKRELDG